MSQLPPIKRVHTSKKRLEELRQKFEGYEKERQKEEKERRLEAERQEVLKRDKELRSRFGQQIGDAIIVYYYDGIKDRYDQTENDKRALLGAIMSVFRNSDNEEGVYALDALLYIAELRADYIAAGYAPLEA